MKTYIIKKSNESGINFDSPIWQGIASTQIDSLNWSDYPSAVNTEVKIIYTDDALFLKYHSDEKNVLATHHGLGSDVYMDSCAEIFLTPNLEDEDYLNFEINAIGTLKLGKGPSRKRRNFTSLEVNALDFEIQTKIYEDGWELMFKIPFSFLKSQFSLVGKEFKGNMQKCAEGKKTPHFLTWNPINTEKPDFHRPEHFGRFILE